LPIRLIEVGASAGLNLRADRFYVPGDAGCYGNPDSPVVLSGGWQGQPPPNGHIEVTERIGGDLSPVDPTTPEGRLRLTAYVWPDQADRLSRLRGAFTLAAEVPAELRAESASATLARTNLVPGTWTVIWHSIFRQRCELAFQSAGADVDDAHGQAELRGDGRSPAIQLRVTLLRQPDQPAVVPEVVSPQLWMPVKAEPGEHRALEAPHQVIGQQVRARLTLEQRTDPLGAA
jgi:hypothetical protein